MESPELMFPPLDMGGSMVHMAALAMIADQLCRQGEIHVKNCRLCDPELILNQLGFYIECETHDGITIKRAVAIPGGPLDERGRKAVSQPPTSLASSAPTGDEGKGHRTY